MRPNVSPEGMAWLVASDLDGTMTVATQPLTDDEIVSLVHFIATLGEP